jgi:hypothetical protein
MAVRIGKFHEHTNMRGTNGFAEEEGLTVPFMHACMRTFQFRQLLLLMISIRTAGTANSLLLMDLIFISQNSDPVIKNFGLS